jgi:hypothetical protein
LHAQSLKWLPIANGARLPARTAASACEYDWWVDYSMLAHCPSVACSLPPFWT